MNPYDEELLEFARRWEPFGGPRAADILVEFGMTPRRFSERLKELRSGAGGRSLGYRRRTRSAAPT